LTEARAAERLATGRYQRGLTPLITVLETERRRRVAETGMIITQQTIWDARTDLILALGGDWRTDESNAPDDPLPAAPSAAAKVAEE
jgi:outer membrane protein TolC